MRFVAVFLVAIFGLVNALPLDDDVAKTIEAARNSELEQMIIDLAEELRELMINGSDDIPILDPLEIDALDLDLDNLLGLGNSHLSVRSMTVSQMSSFVLDTVQVQMTGLLPPRYTVNFEGYIPVVEATAEFYDMHVEMLGTAIFGTGEAKAKALGPRVNASVVVGPRFGWLAVFLEIVSANIQFQLTAFEPELTGIFHDEFMTDFANLFLKNLIPELLDYFESEITEAISSIVVTIGNEILSDLNLIDIIGRQRLSQVFEMPALEDLPPKPDVVV